MSVLAILLPARVRTASLEVPSARPSASSASVAAIAAVKDVEWRFVYSRDGLGIDREGMAAPAQLPRADRTVLVLQDEDVSWLQALLPKSAAKRLQPALVGALEDQLLEDAAVTHLAMSRAGLREDASSWIAAVHKPWVERLLAELTDGGIQIDTLVSLSEPEPDWAAHAKVMPEGQAVAVVSGPQGVAIAPVGWSGWRSRLSDLPFWTAEPTAAQSLSALGLSAARVRLMGVADRALKAAVSGTNLLQFDLAPQMRGSRALRAAWATFKDRRHRAIHVGLVALLLIQIVGLNVAAWQARHEVQQIQAQNERLLRESFPSIKVVVDPLAQAEREVYALRRASGLPGPADPETWLDVLSPAWAGQAAPLKAMRWDAQGASLDATQWPAASLQAMQDHARGLGWQARQEGSVLRLMPPAQGTR